MDSEKILRVGLVTPVQTLDPAAAQDVVVALVVRQIFEAPYALASDNHSAEACLFTGHLEAHPRRGRDVLSAAVRPGIRFSDGTELVADHVAEALSKAEALREHAIVESADGRIQFTLEQPNGRFELVLAQNFCVIGRRVGTNGELLGTGPYRLADERAPGVVRLVKNPCYRESVGFDEIHFTVYPPTAAGGNSRLLRAIEAGEVDFTNAVTRKDVERLSGVKKMIRPGSATAILYFNTERLPDPRVRKAMALAVDREEIASAFYSNVVAFTATSLLPRVLGGYYDDGLSHDLQAAVKLLARPGVRRPERLRLQVIWGPRLYLPQPLKAAEIIAQQLARLGIELEFVVSETSTEYYERFAEGDYDLGLSGWIADTPDPADFLEASLSSHTIAEPGRVLVNSGNEARWRNDAVDRALAHYRQDASEKWKTKILDLVRDQVPLLPLMYGPTIFVHSWDLKIGKQSAFGIPNLGNFEPAV